MLLDHPQWSREESSLTTYLLPLVWPGKLKFKSQMLLIFVYYRYLEETCRTKCAQILFFSEVHWYAQLNWIKLKNWLKFKLVLSFLSDFLWNVVRVFKIISLLIYWVWKLTSRWVMRELQMSCLGERLKHGHGFDHAVNWTIRLMVWTTLGQRFAVPRRRISKSFLRRPA